MNDSQNSGRAYSYLLHETDRTSLYNSRLRKYIIELSDRDDEPTIQSKITSWLATHSNSSTISSTTTSNSISPPENLAIRGREIACTKYSYKEAVQQMIEVWSLYYWEEKRGALFPYPLSVFGDLQ